MDEKNDDRPAAAKRFRLEQELARNAQLAYKSLMRLLLRRLPPEEAKEVRAQVETDGAFSERYVLMCGLSAGIATLGLLQSSSAVVIGAMLVSPLMSPIARLGFSFASLDWEKAKNAARVVGIGAAVGIGVAIAITLLSPIRNATPEIISRTAPTLLDLAVAVLSGFAGGYATVHRRGETAIGVAIATALMPPLATIGYGVAVARWDFAGGATLLFLTNLAAIAFAFAIVARIRGVYRAAKRIELKWWNVALGLLAFFALATPLALTLRQVTHETTAASAARQEISRLFDIPSNQVVQLDVSWGNLGRPTIQAVAVTSTFVRDAETRIAERLAERLNADVDFMLQQIVATDPGEQAQAAIDAAISRVGLPGGGASPPLPSTRSVVQASRLRVSQSWFDSEGGEARLLLAPQAVTVKAMRAEETRLNALGFGWRVKLVPPFKERIPILFGDDEASINPEVTAQLEDALWELERWGVKSVVVEGVSGAAPDAARASRLLSETRAATAGSYLLSRGVRAETRIASRETAAELALEGAARTRSADILPFEDRAGD